VIAHDAGWMEATVDAAPRLSLRTSGCRKP
jgi:hypothetical protein